MNEIILSPFAREKPQMSFSQDFLLSVTMGLVPGYSFVDKFGENPEVTGASDPEDVWEVGGTYIYDTDDTAPIQSLISDAADIQPITVQGLDINGLLVTQTITLTGTVRVALTVPLWRVVRMQNIGATDIAGNVYCYTGTGGAPAANLIRAVVTAANQTLMSIYTIPADKVGFLIGEEIGASRFVAAAEIRAATRVRMFGGVFTTKRRVNLSNAGTSIDRHINPFPDVLPGKSDIKQTVEEVSATVGIFGTIQILLVDANILPLLFLTGIGQPS